MRGWQAAVLGTALTLFVLLMAGGPSVPVMIAGSGAIGAVLIAWFAIGRQAFTDIRVARIFVVVTIVIATIGTAIYPSFATIQFLVFPLLWTLAGKLRTAIIANVVLAVGVGIGLYFSTGATMDSLFLALLTEAISLAFSLALGFWIIGIDNQSQERQRLLEELQDAQARLGTMHRDAGVASERERLAREIHDTIAQDLTGLVMLTQRVRRELESGSTHVVDEQLALLEESARTALAETRALVAASSPVALASGGISDALQRLGERFGRETGLSMTVDATDLPELDRDTEVVLLRVAQEGLANTRKHAAARAASVTAWAHDGTVALRVTDDGTGFDTGAATDGFGLTGMRDRLALIGGSLDVVSSPAGTVLTETLPAAVTS